MRDRPRPWRGERLLREEKLLRRADYQRCYRRGRRRGSRLATLHFLRNDEEHPRLGITASRKVGGAVVRGRLKRRIREIYRRWPGRDRLPALDLVVHLKPAARESEFSQLESEVQRLLSGLLPTAGAR